MTPVITASLFAAAFGVDPRVDPLTAPAAALPPAYIAPAPLPLAPDLIGPASGGGFPGTLGGGVNGGTGPGLNLLDQPRPALVPHAGPPYDAPPAAVDRAPASAVPSPAGVQPLPEVRRPAPAPPVSAVVRPGGPRRPRSMRSLSFTHIALPEPRVVQVHDIVTVLVDEKSEVVIQSRFDRRRTATLEAGINEFLRLDAFGRLVPSATASPGADLEAGVRLQANGGATDAEGIRYRIAAEVVDVLPNGNVVLEARKKIRSNRDVWEYTLTGTIASEKIRRDMTAVSEDVAALKIEKRQSGKVYNSTNPGWGLRALDRMWPF